MPLEDAVLPWFEEHQSGIIEIVGPHGSGRTLALQHLLAILPQSSHIRFLDDDATDEMAWIASGALVICGSLTAHFGCDNVVASFPLTPWGEDEFIEYLLAAHPAECRSVMERMAASADSDLLQGIPELWRLVLDRMAADESVLDVKSALRHELDKLLTIDRIRKLVRRFCIVRQAIPEQSVDHLHKLLQDHDCDPALLRLLRYEGVQVVLAAEGIVAALRSAGKSDYLRKRLPRRLVQEVAACMDQRLRTRLDAIMMVKDASRHATAASILHAASIGWKPGRFRQPDLTGAYLNDAAWPKINLSKFCLGGADLSGADLSGAKLNEAACAMANLSETKLSKASLIAIKAMNANFSRSDLSSIRAPRGDFRFANFEDANLERASLQYALFADANLSVAKFCEADFSYAELCDANIEDADFSGANFRWANLERLRLWQGVFYAARFTLANLALCDLEAMELPDAEFEGADLSEALLTGSIMPRANFQNANLKLSGLADIDWEEANLRDANLNGCTFHLGSSRSGLVGSPIASEGTRTGFYTDEYEEQSFKAPEEIRKANLCGADLRGAIIENVDFYLVDLRGALYTDDQKEHFERCGAILDDRE